MPSIMQEASISPSCGKKRRREELSTPVEVQKMFSSPQLQRYSHIIEPTTILNSEFNNKGTFNRRLLIPRAGRHDLKRQRVDTSERVEESPFFTREPPTSDLDRPQTKQTCDSSERAVAVRRLKVDLSPCHICRRKPTLKSELDAFANCEACRERTCYICIRECLGFGVEQRAVEDQDSSVLTFSFNGTEDGMDLGGTSTFDCASRDGTLEFGSNLADAVWKRDQREKFAVLDAWELRGLVDIEEGREEYSRIFIPEATSN